MSELDHVKRATNLITYVSETELMSDVASVSISAAQVHATLALVEQQRIANLIALATTGGFDMGVLTSNIAHRTLVVRPGQLQPGIAQALGVDNE